MHAENPRLMEIVRRRWERIDWEAPLPPGFVVAEANYMDVDRLGLTEPQRIALNRLFACFTCELFIHFERYVILYLQRSAHRVPTLARALIDRFIAEEVIHTEAFRRLLHRLRPDLYPGADESTRLRFLQWTGSDDLALKLAPAGTFFLLAWLFEEITLFMPDALDTRPEQCAALVTEVMRLHAREEQPHVAIDARVLSQLTERGRALSAAVQILLTLPLLVYVNTKIQKAGRRFVELAASELSLSAQQQRSIRDRGLTLSERWGMQSFARKLEDTDLVGAGLLCWALRRELR
jgi:predicted metal-dependent hydrolase